MLQTGEWAFANWLTIRQPEGLGEDWGPRSHAHRERKRFAESSPSRDKHFGWVPSEGTGSMALLQVRNLGATRLVAIANLG
jgi:hypothetical protein